MYRTGTVLHVWKNYVVRGDSITELDRDEWLERLTANAEVVLVPGSIPVFSDTVESEGRQMKQFWIKYIWKNPKNPPVLLWN